MRPQLRFLAHLLSDPTQRKHAVRWLASLRPGYLMCCEQPWLVFDAIDYLNRIDLVGKHVFEYGSGGSTFYWLRRNAVCVSIEHDPVWFASVSKRLAKSPLVDYRLVLPELRDSAEGRGDPADPDDYASTDESFSDHTFRNYVSQVDAFPNGYFDIILIDGRSRPACIKHSIRKVKLGGIIVLDDSGRDYYLSQTRGYLSSFTEKVFVGAIPTNPLWSATTIFIKRRSS